MALPYPEKVRIVEMMRAAAVGIRSASRQSASIRENPASYGSKKP